MTKKQLTILWQLSWTDRWLLLEATLWLGVARIAILTVPFRKLAKHLGEQMAESPHSDQSAQETRLSRISQISWAVRGMSGYTPWESACLAQALAAKAMLRCRGIASTLYLGLAKDKHNEQDRQSGLLAHAWLRSGSIILTGGPGKDQYTVVATFAEKPA